MAVAAILDLLFLFILVKRPISGSSPLIAAKFYSSTSIGSQDIAVCAKIQDGGRRHLGLFLGLIFYIVNFY